MDIKTSSKVTSVRKLLATIIGWLLAFSLGYLIIPKGFDALINWLSPVFGTSFHLILSTFFLLFADPLKYTILAIVWAVTGFLCGLIIRKRIGSVMTALTVFSGQFVILGLAGFRIFEIVKASGIMASPEKALTLLPPIPAGASLGTILNAPIIGDIYQRVQGVTLQALSIDFVVNLLVNTIILSVVKNIIIIFVAALVGCELGKLISRPFRSRIESFRMRFVKSPPPEMSRLLIVGLTILLASSTISVYLAPARAAPVRYYSETLLGTLTTRGAAIITANFFDTVYFNKIDASDAAFSDCIGALLVAQSNFELISEDLELTSAVQFPTSMYAMLPSTMLVMVYMDIPLSDAQSRASEAATMFSNGFGIFFTQLIAVPQPMGGHDMAIVVYQSDNMFSDTATIIMNYLPEADRDGIASLIGSVYRNGTFTPGRTPLSANGTVISTGLIDTQKFPSIFAGDEAGLISSIRPFLPTNVSGLVPFINVLSDFAGKFHSSPITAHTLKFADILNTDMPIKFSPTTNASTVITVVPTGNTTKAGEVSIPIIKVATTLPASAVNTLASTVVSMISGTTVTPGEKPPPEVVNLAVETVSAGADLTKVAPSFLEITFTSRFPLQLRLVKEVSVTEIDRHKTVIVTVTAYNDDVDQARDVVIDDSAVLQSYSQGAKLISGKCDGSWSFISNRTAAGPSTRSISYTLELLKEGTYTFPAATVSYVYDGVTYTKLSNKVVVRVRSPSLIQVLIEGVPYAWALMARMIDMVPMLQGSGSPVLTVAVVVIVCLIVVLEYRGFRKWVRGEVPKAKE